MIFSLFGYQFVLLVGIFPIENCLYTSGQ